MRLLDHPINYQIGTRVLFLKSRHKDGNEQEREVSRITHDDITFKKALKDLCKEARPNERIYASAGPRDVHKAIRLFKERQLDADYSDDPLTFYDHLKARWISCLMAPTSQSAFEKYWLFDCDTPDDLLHLQTQLNTISAPAFYKYATKSGTHILIRPFDTRQLDVVATRLLHKNPIMLWGYS